MLKKITLYDFMSHEHTELELDQGVNVLVGPNNCGKSAVVEALRAVAEHTRSDFMIRHGEKRCRVVVETSEGDVVEWQRTKTSAKYVLNDRQINRIGRGDLPEELHELLKMPKVQSEDKKGSFDVHLGLQKAPIFLLDQTGSKIATFFASASDAHYLLAMQELHRQQLADARKLQKRLAEDIDANKTALKDFASLGKLEASVQESAHRLAQLRQGQETVRSLAAQHQKQGRTQRQLLQVQSQAAVLNQLEEPPDLFPAERLGTTLTRLKTVEAEKERTEQASAVLEKLQPPPELDDIRPLELLLKRLKGTTATLQAARMELEKINRRLEDCRGRVRRFAQDQATCPHCLRPWSEDEVMELVEKGERHDP